MTIWEAIGCSFMSGIEFWILFSLGYTAFFAAVLGWPVIPTFLAFWLGYSLGSIVSGFMKWIIQ